MASKTSKTSKYGSQVNAEARAKFGSARSALGQALSDAYARYQQQSAAADAGAAGVTATIQRVRPEVTAPFTEAQANRAAIAQQVQGDLAGLGAATPWAAAAAKEDATANRRLSSALANQQAELGQRQLEAEAGRQYGKQRAAADLSSAVGKVQQQMLDLGAQEGDFKQSRIAQLLGEDAARAFQRAQQQRSFDNSNASREDQQSFQAGENQKNRDAKAKGKKGTTTPGGVKKVSASEQGKLVDDTARAVSVIKALQDGGVSKSTALTLLENGAPARTKFDEAAYKKMVDAGVEKPDARRRATKKYPAVSAISNRLALLVALDKVYEGRITDARVKLLYSRGYVVKGLGSTKRPLVRPGAQGNAGVGGKKPVAGVIG